MAIALLLAASGAPAPAGGQGHAGHAGTASTPNAPARPIRISPEALHGGGGVPPGWRFSLPAGDPEAGRRAFVDLKCYTCHQVQGEQFPLKPGEAATAGPELTGMAHHHPTGYIVESIVNPSAVVVDRPGYFGGDGRSIMPAMPEMTVGQLIDLVAYLQSRGGDAGHAHSRGREQTIGGYRVRLAFQPVRGGHDHAHHQQQHGAGSTPPHGKGLLTATVVDAASGQPIPTLPVTASIEATGTPSKTVKLGPAFGADGFHYAADVDLPATTTRIMVSVGPAQMRLEAGAPAQLVRAYLVPFQWK